jgi:CspA family cold shock protein
MVQELGGSSSLVEEVFTIRGTVKWFNPAKGFGFVTPEDGSGDVFMHLSSLRQSGYEAAPDGASIVCEAARRAKGIQVVRIVELGAAPSIPRQQPEGGLSAEQDAAQVGFGYPRPRPKPRFPVVVGEGEFQKATVKWFSPAKGYGFLTCGEGEPDIFIHVAVLRRQGLSDLLPGQTVHVRVGQGPKGPQAAEIQLVIASG